MTAYAIGDVQGCYRSLRQLLDKLRYDDSADELWFCGDLVNRGSRSLQVLRFVRGLAKARAVLGNHDLHLLAVAEGFRRAKPTDTFNEVLAADDRSDLLAWLRHLQLLHFDRKRGVLLVHAGVHPSWEVSTAIARARQVELLLRDDDEYQKLLARMYGDQACGPQDDIYDESRWVINVFTRMRFCDALGNLDFKHVGAPGTQPKKLSPWFAGRGSDEPRVVFGHWSALGARDLGNAVCLDSGCVYGGHLTAVDVDEGPARFIQVPCAE